MGSIFIVLAIVMVVVGISIFVASHAPCGRCGRWQRRVGYKSSFGGEIMECKPGYGCAGKEIRDAR